MSMRGLPALAAGLCSLLPGTGGGDVDGGPAVVTPAQAEARADEFLRRRPVFRNVWPGRGV